MKKIIANFGYIIDKTKSIEEVELIKSVYIPNNSNTDKYKEISLEEADEIISKQKVIKENKSVINWANKDIDSFINNLVLLPQVINELNLTNEQAIKLTNYYPEWITFIGKPLLAGTKVKHNNVLYVANESIANVTIDDSPDKYITNNQPTTMFRSASIKQPKYKLVTK